MPYPLEVSFQIASSTYSPTWIWCSTLLLDCLMLIPVAGSIKIGRKNGSSLMCVHLDMRTEVEESDEQDREQSGSLEHVSQVVEKERPRIQERGDDFAAWLELD